MTVCSPWGWVRTKWLVHPPFFHQMLFTAQQLVGLTYIHIILMTCLRINISYVYPIFLTSFLWLCSMTRSNLAHLEKMAEKSYCILITKYNRDRNECQRWIRSPHGPQGPGMQLPRLDNIFLIYCTGFRCHAYTIANSTCEFHFSAIKPLSLNRKNTNICNFKNMGHVLMQKNC